MTNELTPKEHVDKLFQSMPNVSILTPFVNEHGCGLFVRWAEQGTGFGTFTLFCDYATGKWTADAEAMNPQWVGRMLQRLVGTTVVSEEEMDAEETDRV